VRGSKQKTGNKYVYFRQVIVYILPNGKSKLANKTAARQIRSQLHAKYDIDLRLQGWANFLTWWSQWILKFDRGPDCEQTALLTRFGRVRQAGLKSLAEWAEWDQRAVVCPCVLETILETERAVHTAPANMNTWGQCVQHLQAWTLEDSAYSTCKHENSRGQCIQQLQTRQLERTTLAKGADKHLQWRLHKRFYQFLSHRRFMNLHRVSCETISFVQFLVCCIHQQTITADDQNRVNLASIRFRQTLWKWQ